MYRLFTGVGGEATVSSERQRRNSAPEEFALAGCVY